MSDATTAGQSGGETAKLTLPSGEHEFKIVHQVEGAPGIELVSSKSDRCAEEITPAAGICSAVCHRSR